MKTSIELSLHDFGRKLTPAMAQLKEILPQVSAANLGK
jgi:hypothetical protein